MSSHSKQCQGWVQAQPADSVNRILHIIHSFQYYDIFAGIMKVKNHDIIKIREV